MSKVKRIEPGELLPPADADRHAVHWAQEREREAEVAAPVLPEVLREGSAGVLVELGHLVVGQGNGGAFSRASVRVSGRLALGAKVVLSVWLAGRVVERDEQRVQPYPGIFPWVLVLVVAKVVERRRIAGHDELGFVGRVVRCVLGTDALVEIAVGRPKEVTGWQESYRLGDSRVGVGGHEYVVVGPAPLGVAGLVAELPVVGEAGPIGGVSDQARVVPPVNLPLQSVALVELPLAQRAVARLSGADPKRGFAQVDQVAKDSNLSQGELGAEAESG